MAELRINITQIKENIKTLNHFFNQHNIKWSLITKVFSGDKEFMEHLLQPELLTQIHSVGDSRLSSLKALKELKEDLVTIYIKPPAKIYADELVRWADISMNTSFETIVALNEAAKKQGKTHQIIIMVELGELREGVNRNDLTQFYEKVFSLSNIKVIGLGSNLGCMYGVEPTYDKLMQLALYKEIIELKYDTKLQLISGGSSITLPLLENGLVPNEINHFRIGEAAFFGTSPLKQEQFSQLAVDCFTFYANIIELEEKSLIPDGPIGSANIGQTNKLESGNNKQTTQKAILDFGMLDVNHQDLQSTAQELGFVGITSDMTVVDLGTNTNEKGKPQYQVGDKIALEPNYMAVARLLNSKFIEKHFV